MKRPDNRPLREPKTAKLNLRTTEQIHAAADAAAASEGLSLSHWIERLIIEALQERGKI